jgi:hypothetical protein
VELTPAQRHTLEGLIGLGRGPDAGPDLAQRVRARLEDALVSTGLEEVRWTAVRPLWVGKSLLDDQDRCDGLLDARLRKEGPAFGHSVVSGAGVLFHKAIEIDVASERAADIRAVCDRAAGKLASTDRSFGSFWIGLDELDRAELLAEAGRHLALFRDSFPPIPRKWQSQTELALKVRLADGRVVLSGAPDLVLGRSRRLVVDFKSGGAWPEHPEDARFYALLVSLRTGVVPYRVATFFLQSGEWQAEDVTEETLQRASNRVVHAVRMAAQFAAGHSPDLRPGPHCAWCPRVTDCPAARARAPTDGGAESGTIVHRFATAR